MEDNVKQELSSTTIEGNFDPEASILTDSETTAATSNLVRTYPKVSRHKFDPAIPGQSVANISFMLLKEPVDGVYGFLKVRGAWQDDRLALQDAERIIKRVDSIFPIHQVHVGYWTPITNNENYALEKLDIKMKEREIALRDKAAKEAAEKNEEMRRELLERKELLQQTDKDFDPESLDFYTKKKVARYELYKYIQSGKEKLNKLKKSLKKADEAISSLNKRYPNYAEEWLDNYNKARVQVGLSKTTEEEMKNPIILGNIDETLIQ